MALYLLTGDGDRRIERHLFHPFAHTVSPAGRDAGVKDDGPGSSDLEVDDGVAAVGEAGGTGNVKAGVRAVSGISTYNKCVSPLTIFTMLAIIS